MPLDIPSIHKRLAAIDPDFWRDACTPEDGDENPGDREFVAHAPADISALLLEVELLHTALTTAQERIRDLEQSPMFHNRQKVERIAPTEAPNGAPVSFGWKVGWVADEAVRLRAELGGLRRYLTRSIADDLPQEEAGELLTALSNTDAALIDRWTTAMENPAYAASDAARLRKDVWDLSEERISLDRNLKDCVTFMRDLEPILNVDLNALRLEPDRAAALETVRQAVQADVRFIVRLEPGVWIAEGDPGRTTVKASARRFDTERSARRALSKARRFREYPKATVECVK